MYPLISAALFLCGSLAAAQDLVESASFGWGKAISPNSFGIPGWSLSGEGHDPQLLTDKVILTPPYPGSKRGALWSDGRNNLAEWTVDLEFRAGGPERGSGNLQLWYARDGKSQIGTSSIYTVGRFDGLVLVVDTHGGRGGSIRGFLNDGSADYASHPSVDGLAFGHCDYAYRNLGRPSAIKVVQSSSAFEVLVDGRSCFRTDKIALPSDYEFGITAASSETPDSFEVFKFLLSRSAVASPPPPPSQGNTQQQQQQPLSSDEDRPASDYKTQDAQFADLHSRLQQMNHAMNNLFREVTSLSYKSNDRHAELLRAAATIDQISSVDHRLQAIESTLQSLKRDIEGADHAGQFTKLQDKLVETQDRLLHHLPTTMGEIVTGAAPRMGFFLFVLIFVQAGLAISYVIYKRRRANAPKKYL